MTQIEHFLVVFLISVNANKRRREMRKMDTLEEDMMVTVEAVK